MLLLRLYRLALAAPWRTGPVSIRRLAMLAGFVPLFLALQTVHWVFFLLDDVLFPGYRRVRVESPLFVVGIPRSGTTFLHNVLARDTGRFTTPRLWELVLAPSITQRKLALAAIRLDRWLGGPGRRLLQRLERRAFTALDQVHPVTLDSPEEDYFALLPVFACFLLVVPFPDHPGVWALSRFDGLPDRERRAIMAYYRTFLQRHLYVHGPERQVLSKNPSFSPMVRSLREEFPDARVVFCVRDPLKAAPSLISSLRGGAALFGWDVTDREHTDRFLGMLAHFTEHALDTLPGWSMDRQAFLPMRQLAGDVRASVLELYRRFGMEPDAAFRAALDEEYGRSREYRSGHRYTLEEVGLDEGRIRTRLRRMIDHFEFAAGPTYT